MSQRKTVQEVPPRARVLPSGDRARDVTPAGGPPIERPLPVPASHSHTRPSAVPTPTTDLPSGVKARPAAAPRRPSRRRTSLAVAVSQRRAAPLEPPVARRLPSAEKARACIGPSTAGRGRAFRVGTSQSWTVPAQPAKASVLPSGE